MKQLAGQTAIYGLSSILGRMINFLLVPLQTSVLSQAQYGINVDFYSLIAFFMVITTFGMETAYFRFSEKEGWEEQRVFNTTISMILIVLLGLSTLAYLFHNTILNALRYEDSPEFLIYLLVILGLDAFAAIPFARLRRQNQAAERGPFLFLLLLLLLLLLLRFITGSSWVIAQAIHIWDKPVEVSSSPPESCREPAPRF